MKFINCQLAKIQTSIWQSKIVVPNSSKSNVREEVTHPFGNEQAIPVTWSLPAKFKGDDVLALGLHLRAQYETNSISVCGKNTERQSKYLQTNVSVSSYFALLEYQNEQD